MYVLLHFIYMYVVQIFKHFLLSMIVNAGLAQQSNKNISTLVYCYFYLSTGSEYFFHHSYTVLKQWQLFKESTLLDKTTNT